MNLPALPGIEAHAAPDCELPEVAGARGITFAENRARPGFRLRVPQFRRHERLEAPPLLDDKRRRRVEHVLLGPVTIAVGFLRRVIAEPEEVRALDARRERFEPERRVRRGTAERAGVIHAPQDVAGCKGAPDRLLRRCVVLRPEAPRGPRQPVPENGAGVRAVADNGRPHGEMAETPRLDPRRALDRLRVHPDVPAHLGAAPALHLDRAGVAPDVGAAALRVVHHIRAAARDHADLDGPAGRAGPDHTVVAAMEVNADVPRLIREEAPPEVRRLAAGEGDCHLDRVVGAPRDGDHFVAIGRVHVHPLRFHPVRSEHVVDKPLPPRLQVGDGVSAIDARTTSVAADGSLSRSRRRSSRLTTSIATSFQAAASRSVSSQRSTW